MENSSKRAFVIDLRSQRFGFVLLDMSGTLIDWGVCGYHTSVPEALHRKITHIVDQFAPVLILARRSKSPDHHRERLIRGYLRLLRQEARRYSVPLRVISAARVQEYFQAQGRNNKHQVSEMVAASFPEIAWRLPSKRRSWQSEPAIQVLFDAAALALMHFEHRTYQEEIESA